MTLALRVIGLPKTTWYYHQRHVHDYAEKYAYLRTPLERIARDHPEYSYRRTTVELPEQWKEPINHKVIQKLQKLWDLPLLFHTHHSRPSGIRGELCSPSDCECQCAYQFARHTDDD